MAIYWRILELGKEDRGWIGLDLELLIDQRSFLSELRLLVGGEETWWFT